MISASSSQRKRSQYKGQLTPEQAADGIRSAIQTARGLVNDAALLAQHGRWPRTMSLSILAIEELGKVLILKQLLLVGSKAEAKRTWRDYRDHRSKNILALIKPFVEQVRPSKLEDFEPLFDTKGEHTANVQAVKEVGLYSDCDLHLRWAVPEVLIGKTLAMEFLDAALRLVAIDETGPLHTASELYLWVKHIKPVYCSKDWVVQEQALNACYQEAAQLGVLTGARSLEELLKGF